MILTMHGNLKHLYYIYSLSKTIFSELWRLFKSTKYTKGMHEIANIKIKKLPTVGEGGGGWHPPPPPTPPTRNARYATGGDEWIEIKNILEMMVSAKSAVTPRVRLSPFPRVETRFNTHNQNAFANAFWNAFLELLRLSSISQNHNYEYTVRPRKKQTPETKDAVTKCRGVWL